MVDYRKLLDAFVGAIGRPDQRSSGQSSQGGLRQQAEKSVTQVTGQSPDQLLQKAKDFAVQHPGLTQTALVGLTGNLVKLGGLAVIGGLAYKAYQNQQTAKAPAGGGTDASAAPASGSDEAVAQSA